MPYKKAKSKKSSGLAELTKKVNKLARETKPEQKHAAFNSTAASVDDAGGISALVAIGPGVTDEQRVGNRIKLTHMSLKGGIRAVGTDSAIVRVIIYRDKENLTGVPLNVLRYAGTAQGVMSPYNDDTRQDFAVMYDKTFYVHPGASNETRLFKFDRKLNASVLWNDAAGLEQNNIKMLAISSHPTGSVQKPLIHFSGQFKFTDV